MSRCVFLTLQDRTGFVISDHLLIEPFRNQGWEVQETPWNRPNVDWTGFEAVIIRSTWDYQNAPAAFLSTLESIERQTKLFNPVSICRWNLNKQYLQQLQQADIPIVPTLWLDTVQSDDINRAFGDFGEDRVVIKPVIGANADDTFVLAKAQPKSWETALAKFGPGKKAMVQPFVNSVASVGEYSLFYFGGRFSHAILKTPATGDFRVQEEHGGIIQAVAPDQELIARGEQAIAFLEQSLLYARVDLVLLADQTPVVMELELIEPSLYFETSPTAAALFTQQFVEMMGSG